MRNEQLKIVRNLWKECVHYPWCGLLILTLPKSSARIFFGRGAVMGKALGTSLETEHLPGLHHISQVRFALLTLLLPLTLLRALEFKRSSWPPLYLIIAFRSNRMV